jgi:dihydroxyacetone kinase
MESIDGAVIRGWLRRASAVLEAEKTYLTELDATIGDSDHGENMARGFRAVAAKLNGLADAGADRRFGVSHGRRNPGVHAQADPGDSEAG